MTSARSSALLRRGRRLEYATLGWNVAGTVVLGGLAIRAGSPALAGYGFDSLIEIGASTVVLWELSGASEERERRAMRLIGLAFAVLVVVIVVQVIVVLISGRRPEPSPLGIVWTASTFVVMLLLAIGKLRTGASLQNPVLRTEGRVTLVDAGLAAAVLIGLAVNAMLGWWWADPVAGLVVVYYAAREARTALAHRATTT